MKHRESTGSLAERNGRYTAILNLYDEDGKRRQKSIALGIPVKGNKRKAQAQLEELKRAYSLGLPQEGKTGQDLPELPWAHRRPAGSLFPGAGPAAAGTGAQAHPGTAPLHLR